MGSAEDERPDSGYAEEPAVGMNPDSWDDELPTSGARRVAESTPPTPRAGIPALDRPSELVARRAPLLEEEAPPDAMRSSSLIDREENWRDAPAPDVFDSQGQPHRLPRLPRFLYLLLVAPDRLFRMLGVVAYRPYGSLALLLFVIGLPAARWYLLPFRRAGGAAGVVDGLIQADWLAYWFATALCAALLLAMVQVLYVPAHRLLIRWGGGRLADGRAPELDSPRHAEMADAYAAYLARVILLPIGLVGLLAGLLATALTPSPVAPLPPWILAAAWSVPALLILLFGATLHGGYRAARIVFGGDRARMRALLLALPLLAALSLATLLYLLARMADAPGGGGG